MTAGVLELVPGDMAQSSITKFFRPKPGSGAVSQSPKKMARESPDENSSPNTEDETVTPTKRHKSETEGVGLTPGRLG